MFFSIFLFKRRPGCGSCAPLWGTTSWAASFWRAEVTRGLEPSQQTADLQGSDRGWGGWAASLTQRTWVWANSGRWWRTGKPGVLQFTGSERVGYDWATEQQLVLLCQGDTHMVAFEKKTKFSQTLIVHELWKLRVFILAVTFSLPSATNTWKYAEIPMHKLRRMKFPIHYATCYSYKNLTGKK